MENNSEKIKFVEETLEKLLKESNELWDEGKDKSFIIGYLEGRIKSILREIK